MLNKRTKKDFLRNKGRRKKGWKRKMKDGEEGRWKRKTENSVQELWPGRS